MSSAALSWATYQVVKPATAKLLLMILADHANPHTGRIFPSIARLVAFSGLNEKTVSAGLMRLEELTILIDLGEKTGKTGRTRVFKLNKDWGGPTVPRVTPKTVELSDGNTPENGGSEYPRKRATEPRREEPSIESPLAPQGEEGDQGVDLFGMAIVPPEQAFADAIAERFGEGWSDIASRYPRVPGVRLPISPRLRSHLLARVREHVTGNRIEEGVGVVNALLEKVEGSPFLCGEVKDWAPGPDWVLGPENFEKTMQRRNERALASNNGPTGAGSSSVVAGARALALLRNRGERP